MKRRSFLSGAIGAALAVPYANALAREFVALAAAGGELAARSLEGGAIALAAKDVEALAASMRGAVLVPTSAGYDTARRLWNGLFDKRPALIAQCASPSDVMQAVNFAREHSLLTAVRCGGHSASGKSSCDGGIMIDLAPMQAVRVDPVARTARVEGGALLGHLDRETRAFGLVTTAGVVSHTGAAGLTLGGGFGRLARRFGLACDNLIAADVVTAAGQLVHASETENPDLLWGLRGGGGNFGVATSIEYRLYPFDHTVLGGQIVWPFEQAREVLRFLAEYSAKAPDELNVDFSAGAHPKLKAKGIGVECCWSADHAQGEKVLRPLRTFGKPLVDTVAPASYLRLQSQVDQVFGHGVFSYVKAGFVTELTDPLIDTLVEEVAAAPEGKLTLTAQQGGGAMGRIRPTATAFPNRNANFWIGVSSLWRDPSVVTDERVAIVRAAWKKIEPATTGFYVNAMQHDDVRRVDENYGENYARLVRLKDKYDPKNLFRLNANVKPTARA